MAERAERVDPHEPANAAAERAGGIHDGIAAHGVPDEGDVVGADLLDHGDDVVAEGREVPVASPQTRFAVATEVERDDLVPLGEEVDLAGPVGAVAGPPVDQDDGERGAGGVAMDVVRKLDAVVAACHEWSLAQRWPGRSTSVVRVRRLH